MYNRFVKKFFKGYGYRKGIGVRVVCIDNLQRFGWILRNRSCVVYYGCVLDVVG